MKLLFDQNLSPKLVNRLADLFPGSSHVQAVGLDCASDDQVWEHARLNGFAIVTKDEDYNNLRIGAQSLPEARFLGETGLLKPLLAQTLSSTDADFGQSRHAWT